MPDATGLPEDMEGSAQDEIGGEPADFDVWVTVESSPAGRATVTAHPSAKRKRDVRIGAEEPLADALQRICLEQLDRAWLALAKRELDEGIHTTRKAMKRIRAILRLSRDGVGARVYRAENMVLRDAARLIAPVRDAVVAIETLDHLVDPFKEHLVPDTVADLRSQLEARHLAEHERVGAAGSVLEVATVLEGARARFANWPTSSADAWGRKPIKNEFAAIASGIRRTYRRGRRGLEGSERDGSVASYHEWRKRAKYLRYQLETLAPMWPETIDGAASTLDELGESLGTEHDLALFSQSLASGRSVLDPAARELLVALASQQRSRLRRTALPLGRRVYSEPPDRFVGRLASYWQAWRPT